MSRSEEWAKSHARTVSKPHICGSFQYEWTTLANIPVDLIRDRFKIVRQFVDRDAYEETLYHAQ